VGLFNVRVTLRNAAQPARQCELELLVDTGSLFTWVDTPVLEEMGILPAETSDFHTITGAVITRKIGYALVAWNGRTGAINVVFAEPGDMSVLGVTALESLRVTPDPIRQVLVPTVALAV
jgi:predicted aspartyl protease